MTVTLSLFPESFAICQLPAESAPPAWAWHGTFCSVTRTPTEVSIVCAEADVPGDVRCERGWRVLAVKGTIPFGATGILSALAEPLAGAGVSIFTLSTFDTDYLLVTDDCLPNAVAALRMAGNTVEGDAEFPAE
ncbi:MAG: ACT domain-containing protein [Armatimonadetes bacterium]|nr:ACT domain-containing protein [Armatimonadota bacterium]